MMTPIKRPSSAVPLGTSRVAGLGCIVYRVENTPGFRKEGFAGFVVGASQAPQHFPPQGVES